jgi:hypothetical protein
MVQAYSSFYRDDGTDALDIFSGQTYVISYNGRHGIVTPAAGDYTASQVTNVPAGNISSTTVQDALNELDTEKVGLSTENFWTGPNHYISGNLRIRSSAAAFDIRFGSDDGTLTLDRNLTWRLQNGNRVISLGGDLTLGGTFQTIGAQQLTLTTTGATNVTLPTSGTLVNEDELYILLSAPMASLRKTAKTSGSSSDDTLLKMQSTVSALRLQLGALKRALRDDQIAFKAQVFN